MTEQEVRTLLTDALVNLFEIEPERIKPETNLYEDLEIDSIDAIDLIDHMVGRVLDLFNIEQGLNPPWDPPARRGQPRQDEENP